MNLEQKTYLLALPYLQLSFISLPFVFIFLVFQALMRGIGEVKIPFLIVLSTVLLNLVLDPLFIFGYGPIKEFGVLGAAIATLLTQGFAALIAIYILIKQGKLALTFLDPLFLKNVFKLGIPASIEQLSRSISMLLMTFIVAILGTNVIAGFGIGVRILSFVIIPIVGISAATSSLVGQAIGAKNIKKAKTIGIIALLVSFFGFVFIGALLFIFSKDIVLLFMPNGNGAINIAIDFTKTLSLLFGFIAIQIIISGVFRGAGETRFPMFISLIFSLVLRVVLSYALAIYLSLNYIGILASYSFTYILGSIIMLWAFISEKWNTKQSRNILLAKTIEEAIIEEGYEE